MKLIRQTSRKTSGQACIAMILDCLIDDAVSMVGHSKEVSDNEMESVLGVTLTSGAPSKRGTYLQKHEEGWSVLYKGSLFNPGSSKGEVLKYAEVVLENEAT